MNANHKLLETLNELGKKREPVERLYARMLDEELFLTAYGRLYSNKGAMTSGVDETDSIDGMSLTEIQHIIQCLHNNEWHWKPARRIYVPKANGKERPLSIPGWQDKLVQEVMRMVLEAYYEPNFLEESHGFRPGRGCHTALSQIKRRWTGVVWFIEGDIKGCFDNIDHDQLLGLLGHHIRDFRFLKLVKTMLKAGYWAEGTTTQTLSGTPQGGVVSPLLANIFLHELDVFVTQNLKPEFDRGTRRQENHNYELLGGRLYYAQRQGHLEVAKQLYKERRKFPRSDAFDPNFRRLLYVRYADDFLIGVMGSKAEAHTIQQKVGTKLSEMGLTLSEEKTKITHASDAARFLGYDIYARNRLDDRHLNGKVMLSVPLEVVTKLKQRYCQNGYGSRRPPLLRATDEEIIQQYDSELSGYYQYYQLAYNVSNRIGSVKTVMWWSLMHTLAGKHRSRISKMLTKFRMTGPRSGLKCIGVTIESTSGKRRHITFGDFSLKWSKEIIHLPDRDAYHKGLRTRELTHRLKHDVCELCGRIGDTEVHHIRRMKDVRQAHRNGQIPRWKLIMSSRNRKTLVVCHECHRGIHLQMVN